MSTVVLVKTETGVEIAADRRMVWGSTPVDDFSKLIRIQENFNIGVVGDGGLVSYLKENKQIYDIETFYVGGPRFLDLVYECTLSLFKQYNDACKTEQFCSIMYAAVSGAGYICQSGIHLPLKNFLAIGSGADYALGALDRGADASDAVETAIRFDVSSGGKVESYFIEQDMHP